MAEKKLFDVGKPGTAKPETGSKPMVIGHKSLASDPSIKEEKSNPESVEEKNEIITEKSKIKLEPILNESSEESADKDKKDPGKEQTVKDQTTENVEAKDSNSAGESDQKTAEEQKGDKEKEQAQKQIELDERLDQIIKSKEYFVPIKEKNKTAAKSFLLTSILVCAVGVLLILALADAEVIDLGIELPFNIF